MRTVKNSTEKDQTFRIYARAVIKNSEAQVLLIKKHENQKIAGGQWLLPGGAIEFGESPEQALQRELKEEINFIATDFFLIASETRIIKDTHWLGLIYEAKGDVTVISNQEPEKHSDMSWHDRHPNDHFDF
jgi:8-oxo-dGTP diphosphatase